MDHIFVRAGCLFHARAGHYSLNNRISAALFSSDVTWIPPGFPLPPASVGHAVQTDQRSHDKERANTGALSAASTSGQTARGHRKGKSQREEKKKSGGLFFSASAIREGKKNPATVVALDDVVYWESVEQRRRFPLHCEFAYICFVCLTATAAQWPLALGQTVKQMTAAPPWPLP